MRIGIYPSFCDAQGNFLDAAGLAAQAKRVEAAGLDGIRLGDHLPTPGDDTVGLPDSLMWLAISAAATTDIEIGTNILGVPVRNRYDILQRLYTLETLFPGRFTIGVGTGSQRPEYDAVGVAWEDRFQIMREAVDEIRSMAAKPDGANLGTSDASMVGTWAQIAGIPRLMLGAWNSELQLKRAATDYDGWLTSGWLGLQGVGWEKSFSETIKRYRDFGGTRAMVSTVQLDLHRPTVDSSGSERFDLYCSPAEATDRLGLLAEMGYDDVIVNRVVESSTRRVGPHMAFHTLEDLEEIRSLAPKAPSVVATAKKR